MKKTSRTFYILGYLGLLFVPLWIFFLESKDSSSLIGQISVGMMGLSFLLLAKTLSQIQFLNRS